MAIMNSVAQIAWSQVVTQEVVGSGELDQSLRVPGLSHQNDGQDRKILCVCHCDILLTLACMIWVSQIGSCLLRKGAGKKTPLFAAKWKELGQERQTRLLQQGEGGLTTLAPGVGGCCQSPLGIRELLRLC